MADDWRDLSDDELTDRLLQRGHAAHAVAHLVDHRDDQSYQRVIVDWLRS